MRNKIQKYLSGSREGFSLVELIIVIAIMAILIGVVALAVLPYLEKSRESKDLSTMDTVCSALVTAVADTQTSGNGDFEFSTTEATGTSLTEAQKVNNSMLGTMGNASTDLKSSQLKDASLMCYFNATSNVAFVYAKDSSGVCQLKRTITGQGNPTVSGTNKKPDPDPDGKYAVVSN